MRTKIGANPTMIEVHVPKLFPTLSIRDTLTVEKWYVEENDVVQPGDLLVSLETPPGFFDIPTPPGITAPHHVTRVLVAEGDQAHLGDLLIRLEPSSVNRQA